MAVYRLGDVAPQIADSAWIADSAQVIGNVQVADNVGIWFGVVARGDTERLTIGKGTNVQDMTMLHADKGFPLTIGDNVTVGHKVVLHGCTIGDGSLIGIGAIILNGAKIGKNCIVGAGALITEGKEFPDGSMILGGPAKVVRELTDQQQAMLQLSALHYVENAKRFKKDLTQVA